MNVTIDPALIRAACLFGPLIVVMFGAATRPLREREIAAAIAATAWNLASLPAVNLLARQVGWWTFDADGGVVADLPIDLVIGWAIWWGIVPILVISRGISLPVVAAGMAWLDLVLMPVGDPVIQLGANWLIGELTVAAVALLPALFLARWTMQRQRLALRASAQVVISGTLMFVWPVVLVGPHMPSGVWIVTLQVVAVPVLLGVAAVREFAQVGRGTPLPYDAPERLVTGGPYAYVRNPMQLSVVLGHIVLSVAMLDWRFLIGSVAAVAYCVGIAAWHEGEALALSHGNSWRRYATYVRPWIPRWRPWSETPSASLYVSQTCTSCSPVGSWMARRAPIGLRVLPAERYREPLRRITYETDDGYVRTEGIVAIARALGHLNLAWAFLGWILVVPGIQWFVQTSVDALGGGPRTIPVQRGSGFTRGF
jgi:protein-S-isoprenylcysteine O-methyltransferase Ste14